MNTNIQSFVNKHWKVCRSTIRLCEIPTILKEISDFRTQNESYCRIHTNNILTISVVYSNFETHGRIENPPLWRQAIDILSHFNCKCSYIFVINRD